MKCVALLAIVSLIAPTPSMGSSCLVGFPILMGMKSDSDEMSKKMCENGKQVIACPELAKLLPKVLDFVIPALEKIGVDGVKGPLTALVEDIIKTCGDKMPKESEDVCKSKKFDDYKKCVGDVAEKHMKNFDKVKEKLCKHAQKVKDMGSGMMCNAVEGAKCKHSAPKGFVELIKEILGLCKKP